jgi:predicted transcriptional regulator
MSIFEIDRMNIRDLIRIIDGILVTSPVNLNRDIKGGFGADLMSDVLASIQPEAVLVTGLCNPQVVRTAQMADVAAIVLVRGKQPPEETIQLANKESVPLISTPHGMFEACGRLHEAGLVSLERPIDNGPCDCG